MGLFDIFKKKTTPQPTTTKDTDQALFNVITKLKTAQTPDTLQELSAVLKTYVDNGTPISTSAKPTKNGLQPHLIQSEGNAYAVLYSATSEIKATEKITNADITQLLQPVFDNTDIAGIVIDPDTIGLFLDKGFLLKCILHGYLPTQDSEISPQKDWGVGIPEYSQEDLMEETEMLYLAMDTFFNNERMITTFAPVSACDHPDTVANLIFEDNGRFVFIVVKGYCAEQKPELSPETKTALQHYSKLFNARCYYAPVSFHSVDEARSSACLALKGDGFYSKYDGLEKI